MGPLCFCNSCGTELAVPWKIINATKAEKLQNVDLEKLCTFDQESLLGNSMKPLMDDLQLALCCRTVIKSYVDMTSEICN